MHLFQSSVLFLPKPFVFMSVSFYMSFCEFVSLQFTYVCSPVLSIALATVDLAILFLFTFPFNCHLFVNSTVSLQLYLLLFVFQHKLFATSWVHSYVSNYSVITFKEFSFPCTQVPLARLKRYFKAIDTNFKSKKYFYKALQPIK